MNTKKVSALFGQILILIGLSVAAYPQSATETNTQIKGKLFEEATIITKEFVARWHETLDLKALQEEFYTKDIRLWQAILGGRIGWEFEGIMACNSDFFVQRNLPLIQQAAFSIATYHSLVEEYDVYYYGLSSDVRVYPDDIANIGFRIQMLLEAEEGKIKSHVNTFPTNTKNIDCDEKLQAFLRSLITEVDASSALFRLHLPIGIFHDEQYKTRLQELITAEIFEGPPDSSIDTDLYELLRFHHPEAQLLAETNATKCPLIEVRKGIFNFVFVQDGSQLKLLFAMPTRVVDK